MESKIQLAHRNFCMVRKCIDSTENMQAYRIMHFIPLWFFLEIETEQDATDKANEIIKNVNFWQWFISECRYTKKDDFHIIKNIWDAIDNEDKEIN